MGCAFIHSHRPASLVPTELPWLLTARKRKNLVSCQGRMTAINLKLLSRKRARGLFHGFKAAMIPGGLSHAGVSCELSPWRVSYFVPPFFNTLSHAFPSVSFKQQQN